MVVAEKSRPNVDLERTGCGDASACLSFVTHPVDVGRLRIALVQEACRTDFTGISSIPISPASGLSGPEADRPRLMPRPGDRTSRCAAAPPAPICAGRMG